MILEECSGGYNSKQNRSQDTGQNVSTKREEVELLTLDFSVTKRRLCVLHGSLSLCLRDVTCESVLFPFVTICRQRPGITKTLDNSFTTLRRKWTPVPNKDGRLSRRKWEDIYVTFFVEDMSKDGTFQNPGLWQHIKSVKLDDKRYRKRSRWLNSLFVSLLVFWFFGTY